MSYYIDRALKTPPLHKLMAWPKEESMSTWRDKARPIIAKVLRETEGQDEKAIRKALRDAYPWGQRAMHPYKVWLDEIRRQRGLKTTGPRKGKLKDVPPDPRQRELFDDEDG